jgi:hypothetical protein
VPGLSRPEQATAEKRNTSDQHDSEEDTSSYVTQLEKRIDEKNDVIGFLRGQLVAKDQQSQISRHVLAIFRIASPTRKNY